MDNESQTAKPHFLPGTKREITRAYRCGDIGLSDAVMWLRDDYGMSHGEAFRYLGL